MSSDRRPTSSEATPRLPAAGWLRTYRPPRSRVTLRLANSSDQLIRLLERAPDPTGLAERVYAGINDAVAGRRS